MQQRRKSGWANSLGWICRTGYCKAASKARDTQTVVKIEMEENQNFINKDQEV